MLDSINNMLVYHGSYTVVEYPNLKFCDTFADFGKGFYLTTDKNQAIRFAKSVGKRHSQNYGIVNVYMLSNFDGLDVYEFMDVSADWLNCIAGFRNRRYYNLCKAYRKYDVILGKVADDDTSLTLNNYVTAGYGEIGSEKAVKTAIELLEPDKLKDQIALRTKKAISRIQFLKSESVRVNGH